MPTSEPTYCVAQVRIEALEAWRSFCDTHLIDRTVLCEAIGAWMATDPDLPPLVEQWVRDARDLKNQRRRRG